RQPGPPDAPRRIFSGRPHPFNGRKPRGGQKDLRDKPGSSSGADEPRGLPPWGSAGAKKNPDRLAAVRIPSVLKGPSPPSGSRATLSVPPSERLRPIALRPRLTTGLPFRGRLLVTPFRFVAATGARREHLIPTLLLRGVQTRGAIFFRFAPRHNLAAAW